MDATLADPRGAMETIVRAPTTKPSEMFDLFGRTGIVVLPGYLDEDETSQLRKEFELVFERDDAWIDELDYWAGRGRRIHRDGLMGSQLTTLAELFDRPMMREWAGHYFDRDYELNREIYATHDLPREKTINDLHFDRLETLKFFFYLEDTTEENGAFDCVPGSHQAARAIREAHLKRGGKVQEIPNHRQPPDLSDPIPIEGEAGTLIVFTTDIYHRGGHVSEGMERKVLRGHTRTDPPPVYGPSLLSRTWRQWFRQSALNPMRYVWKARDAIDGF